MLTYPGGPHIVSDGGTVQSCFEMTVRCRGSRLLQNYDRSLDLGRPPRRRSHRARKRGGTRIKNPRRQYNGEQHGHHVTRPVSRPVFGVPPRRRRSIILRPGVVVSSRDRSMWVAVAGEQGPGRQEPAPGERSLSRRRAAATATRFPAGQCAVFQRAQPPRIILRKRI